MKTRFNFANGYFVTLDETRKLTTHGCAYNGNHVVDSKHEYATPQCWADVITAAMLDDAAAIEDLYMGCISAVAYYSKFTGTPWIQLFHVVNNKVKVDWLNTNVKWTHPALQVTLESIMYDVVANPDHYRYESPAMMAQHEPIAFLTSQMAQDGQEIVIS